MLHIPFYQTTWNSIDLVVLSKEIGMKYNTLPTHDFYDAYYKKLNAQPELLQQKWIDGKLGQSQWLEEQILNYGDKKSQAISIGAGLGIIELPLIQKGFNIQLQDFQSSSFKHMSLEQITTCYSGNWDDLPSNKFDLCFSMATSYAFDQKTLSDFTVMVSRILKPQGTCILMDTSLSWREIYIHARNFNRYKKEKVLWGYKRSFGVWKKAFKNFDVIDQKYYASGMEEISVKTLMGIAYSKTPYRQVMTFRKKV